MGEQIKYKVLYITLSTNSDLSISGLNARKHVFGVSDKVRFKLTCSATKVLIRLCICSGWSAPLLFACQVFNKVGFYSVETHIRLGIVHAAFY